jgi:hypothetical protein
LEPPSPENPAQRLVRRHDVPLPNELLKGSRAHTLCERDLSLAGGRTEELLLPHGLYLALEAIIQGFFWETLAHAAGFVNGTGRPGQDGKGELGLSARWRIASLEV